MKFLLASIAVFSSAFVATLATGQVKELTTATFESYMKVSKLAIVDFYAPWCQHCRHFAPIYDDIAAQAQAMKLNVFFAKVNCVEESGKAVCKQFDIKFLPTIKMFSDGQVLGDYNGKRTAGAVLDFLKKGVNSLDSMKLMMADDLGGKIPSNVTPWHADDKKHR